ncbi:FAD-dependent oxidoreductase [Granulicella sp. dw_53]|uniref:flavin monoamine oxidase family protein n=1 Tax=Granulicella sp. dw_53 TaxID=2719792 RepID=UPI0023DFDD99|nr:FAD-dependent oxidoreductase [Granulicella sp. dw_53]
MNSTPRPFTTMPAILTVLRAKALFSPPADTTAAETIPSDTPIERRGKAKRVLIIGAGLSGLVAGFELMRAGHDVTILEGQMRPGGRVHTLRSPFSDGLTTEAGAGRIPANHRWTYKYIQQFGLKTIPFAPESLATLVSIQGQQVSLTPATRLSQHFDLSREEQGLGLAELAERYIVPAIRTIRSSSDITAPDWPPASLQKFDQYTLPEFLRGQGASRAATDLLLSGALTQKASALYVLRVLAATDLNRTEKIQGGNDLLPRAIADRLADRIIYGSRVVSFAEEESRVSVTFLQDGTYHSLEADYLICSLPFSVLRNLESMPHFSQLKRQAIREMPYMSMVKVALQTKTRYWEQQGLSGFVQADLAEIWSPAWDQASPRGILQLYQEGEVAEELDRMSPEQRLRFAASYIGKVFPGLSPDFEQSTSYSWQLDKFACGAAADLRPGDLYSWYPAVASAEGRIHFAGEHTSATPAFMQGAITSGYRAATEVNERS